MPDGRTHCGTPPSITAWIGCLKGEHAGPLAYCAHHVTVLGRGPMICAQCGGAVRVLKITSMDGHSTVAYPAQAPPASTWRTIFTPP